MGGIDLDPASCAIANTIVKAERFFTQEDDGLSQEWKGRVWVNPPYAARLVAQFAGKLVAEFRAGRVSSAVVLVNNATETRWFQSLADAASSACFPSRRLRFWHPDRPDGATGLQGQAVLYFGEDVQGFSRQFARFGAAAPLPPRGRPCAMCGEAMGPRRADAKTCGSRCRQRLRRVTPTGRASVTEGRR
jgi:ParB family chromosome partitioning protein